MARRGVGVDVGGGDRPWWWSSVFKGGERDHSD